MGEPSEDKDRMLHFIYFVFAIMMFMFSYVIFTGTDTLFNSKILCLVALSFPITCFPTVALITFLWCKFSKPKDNNTTK